ncbi:MAG: response regulator transcription factor [Dokdonella sp.]
MRKQLFLYGLVLAFGTLALQWFDYFRIARSHAGDIYVFLVALGFLAIGIFLGAKVFSTNKVVAFDGNAKACEALGISARELDVLKELAAGHSNKEIAAQLHVSPNTVKTHVANLFEKLGARRRTDAIHRARDLGILS